MSWSTCEQGFVSRGEILYGILAISVVNFENLSKYYLGKKVRRILVSYLFLPGTIFFADTVHILVESICIKF